jgi:hypothetical protein
MNIKIVIGSDNYICSYATVGHIEGAVEIEIEDDSLSDFKENFKNYKYHEGTISKDDDRILELKKEELKTEITAHRDTLWETNYIEYDGRKQRYRLKDSTSMSSVRSDLIITQAAAQETENQNAILEEREPETIILTEEWYFWDGSSKDMTIQDFTDLSKLIKPALRKMYQNEAALKYSVAQMTTEAELVSFDISSMWNIV